MDEADEDVDHGEWDDIAALHQVLGQSPVRLVVHKCKVWSYHRKQINRDASKQKAFSNRETQTKTSTTRPVTTY